MQTPQDSAVQSRGARLSRLVVAAGECFAEIYWSGSNGSALGEKDFNLALFSTYRSLRFFVLIQQFPHSNASGCKLLEISDRGLNRHNMHGM